MTSKLRQSQAKASRRWEEKNPERARYIRYRSSARNFLNNHATEDDLKEMEGLIQERRKALQAKVDSE